MPKGIPGDYTRYHLRRDREDEPRERAIATPVDGHCPRCDARLHQLVDRDWTCWTCGYRWAASYLAKPLKAGRIDAQDFRVWAASVVTEAIGETG